MKSYLLTVLVVALSLVSTVVGAQTQHSLDTVLDELAAKGMEFRSFEADIDRTKFTVFVNHSATDFGKVYFTGRGEDSRIRMTIFGQSDREMVVDDLLIADGKLQVYSPGINQVKEREDLGDRQDIAEYFMLGFGPSNAELRQDYEITLVGQEVVGDVQTSVLDLEPKNPEVAALFTTIRLWVDQSLWIPVQTRVTELSGDSQTVLYSNRKRNEGISDSTFDLDLPSDVQRMRM